MLYSAACLLKNKQTSKKVTSSRPKQSNPSTYSILSNLRSIFWLISGMYFCNLFYMYTVGYMEVFSNLCSVLYFFYFCNVCICNSVLCILFILIQHFFSVMIIMKFVLFFFIAEMENPPILSVAPFIANEWTFPSRTWRWAGVEWDLPQGDVIADEDRCAFASVILSCEIAIWLFPLHSAGDGLVLFDRRGKRSKGRHGRPPCSAALSCP